jgi:hypothetical protein
MVVIAVLVVMVVLTLERFSLVSPRSFFGERLGVQDEVEVAEALLAFAGELDGLHRGDLVLARGVQSIYERVVTWEVDLAMEEIGGVGDGFRNVGKHVDHGLVDAGTISAAVDPLAILGSR